MVTWDEAKRKANLAKHGVDLALAKELDWETAIIEEDDSEAYGEQREIARGMIGQTMYVYVYTLRGDEDPAISLRPATKPEKRKYVKEIRNPHR
jgi:uncharacterized DUF497 family protein